MLHVFATFSVYAVYALHVHAVCLWRISSPSLSINKVQLALISFVAIGSRVERQPKQSQGYSLVTFTGALRTDFPVFHLALNCVDKRMKPMLVVMPPMDEACLIREPIK